MYQCVPTKQKNTLSEFAELPIGSMGLKSSSDINDMPSLACNTSLTFQEQRQVTIIRNSMCNSSVYCTRILLITREHAFFFFTILVSN